MIESEEQYEPQLLREIGDQVLEIFFNVKLYSLADSKSMPRSIWEVFRRPLEPLPNEVNIAQFPPDFDIRDCVRWAAGLFEQKDLDELNKIGRSIIDHYGPPQSVMPDVQFTTYAAEQSDTVSTKSGEE